MMTFRLGWASQPGGFERWRAKPTTAAGRFGAAAPGYNQFVRRVFLALLLLGLNTSVALKTSQLANGGSRLQITVRHTAAAVVDASIRDVGSQLVYRTAFCKRVALLPGSTP